MCVCVRACVHACVCYWSTLTCVTVLLLNINFILIIAINFFVVCLTVLNITLQFSLAIYCVSQKSEPLNILQQQPQICSDLNKILHTQDDITTYTVSQKKTRHQTLSHNFTNYYPIFKIFSVSDSAVNLQQTRV